MAKEASSQGRLAKFFGISAEEHGDSQWRPDSDAEFEVIGLGLSRTGTTSLRAALDMLGFGPVHHGVVSPIYPERVPSKKQAANHMKNQEIFRRPDYRERVIDFIRYLKENPQETKKPGPETVKRLRTLTKGYRSTLDGPICDLVPELVAAYPNAKYILTVRDSEESWWRSWDGSVGIHFASGFWRVVYRTLISSVTLLRRMDDMCQEQRPRFIRDFGSIGPHMYTIHNQQVRDLVPKGQLLEYHVREGWGPLCAFLEVDVPDKPFPHLNEGDSIKAIYFGMQVFGAVTWAFYLGAAGGAAYLAYKPQVALSFLHMASDWISSRIG